MSSAKCGECGASFSWDPDVGSAVCLQCGTLQDPDQTVLSSQLDAADSGRDEYRQLYESHTTLKSVSDGKGWSLAGQGKEVALTKNRNAMRHFIADLASRIGHQGLAPRIQMLFDQAMSKGSFRWGRRAKLVAGACALIAVRESHKGVANQDLAFLMNEPLEALERSFSSIIRLLEINLAFDEPDRFLPMIATYLTSLLSEQPNALPLDLLSVLKKIGFPAASQTAKSLSDLTMRSGILTHLPPAPTACAIFILALEGEAMASLPHYGELAKVLGRRFGVGKDVIMKRYKVIYEEIEKRIGEVPWLAETSGKGGKTARRVLVARSLKDVVSFKEDLWKDTQNEVGLPELSSIEIEESEELNQEDQQLKRKADESVSIMEQLKKKACTAGLEATSRYLLAPLEFGSKSKGSRKKVLIPPLDEVTHAITAETPTFEKRPTRLQKLVGERGERAVADEELFEDGELEGMMRTQDEMDALVRVYDWAHVGDDGEQGDAVKNRKANVQKKNKKQGGTSRVNMEALNRLLTGMEEGSWKEDGYFDDEEYEEAWTKPSIDGLFGLSGDGSNYGEDAQDIGLDQQTHDSSSAMSPASYVADSYDNDTPVEDIEPWRPISPDR